MKNLFIQSVTCDINCLRWHSA